MFTGLATFCVQVKDLKASQKFYEALGFTHKVWDFEDKSLVLTNGDIEIALMTFLDGNSLNLRGADVLELHKSLKSQGFELDGDPWTYDANDEDRLSGGSAWMTKDPDGNGIFFDTNGSESGEAGEKRRLKRVLESTLRQLEMIEAGDDCILAFTESVMDKYMPD